MSLAYRRPVVGQRSGRGKGAPAPTNRWIGQIQRRRGVAARAVDGGVQHGGHSDDSRVAASHLIRTASVRSTRSGPTTVSSAGQWATAGNAGVTSGRMWACLAPGSGLGQGCAIPTAAAEGCVGSGGHRTAVNKIQASCRSDSATRVDRMPPAPDPLKARWVQVRLCRTRRDGRREPRSLTAVVLICRGELRGCGGVGGGRGVTRLSRCFCSVRTPRTGQTQPAKHTVQRACVKTTSPSTTCRTGQGRSAALEARTPVSAIG